MICYKDMTFCEERTCDNFDTCNRALTDKVQAEADEWWGKGRGIAPIARWTERPVCYTKREEIQLELEIT